VIRVLLAEDSLTVRQLLVEVLQSDLGLEVVGQAKDGGEAVELARRLRPDIVVMDVHMPVMDGLAATKEIMVYSPVPIVIISSSSSAGDVEIALNAMRAGALMVLQKPDDPGSARFDGRREQLIQMVKAMAQVKVVRRWAPRPAPSAPVAPGSAADPRRPAGGLSGAAARGPAHRHGFRTRPGRLARCRQRRARQGRRARGALAAAPRVSLAG
jgi:two-component system chemotaxis response regulator CheB